MQHIVPYTPQQIGVDERKNHTLNEIVNFMIQSKGFKYSLYDHILKVFFFPIDDQVANIFTKSLTEAKFSKLRSMLGFQEVVINGR